MCALDMLLIKATYLDPYLDVFSFNWLLSFINIVMPSRSVFVVGWALN